MAWALQLSFAVSSASGRLPSGEVRLEMHVEKRYLLVRRGALQRTTTARLDEMKTALT
jgi:hypothetical protein